MEVKVIKNEALFREYEITYPAKGIVEKVDSALEEKRKDFAMPGFRKGNVPMHILKKSEGNRVMQGIIEKEVEVILQELFEKENVRPALSPSVEIKSFDEDSNMVINVSMEIIPDTPKVEWDKISIEFLKIKVQDSDLQKAHDEIISNFKDLEEAPNNHIAKVGDHVMMDFKGKIDGKDFEGGSGTDIKIEIGSKTFIPGFEDNLIGARAGSKKTFKVMFPKDYQEAKVAGKIAVFEVQVKQILVGVKVSEIDDSFARKMGMESLEQLNDTIKAKIQSDFDGLARMRNKKLLFDQMDAQNRFDIPDGMISADFEIMWAEIKKQRKENPEMFKGISDDEAKEKYKELAKRRVRLGIILAEFAKNEGIEVLDSDVEQDAFKEAMQHPGKESMILEHYNKPENAEKLKGPILEEKAVDNIFTKITLKEVEITSEEFFSKYADEINEDALAGQKA